MPIPASADYRKASSADRSCANCSYYSTGTVRLCGMYDTLVEPGMVCNQWAKGQDAMPGQEKWHPEDDGVTAAASAEHFLDLLEEIAYVAAVHQPSSNTYGDTYWQPDADGKGPVFWNAADWSTDDECDNAVAAFMALEYVTEVIVEAEAGPPTGDGWRKAYPNALTAALPARHSKPVIPVETHNRVLRRAYKAADVLEPRLVKILEPILAQAGAEAARRFEEKATDHLRASLAAAADIGPRTTMIAVYPRPEEAEALAIGDEAPENIHVTLCYLGELGPDDLQKVIAGLAVVAGTHPPLEGTVGGVGAFDDNGNGVPAIGLPDVRGLVELRQDVAKAITQIAGVDYSRQHGYCPHLTVAYLDGDTQPDLSELLGKELHFDHLHVVQSDNHVATHPLTGAPSLTAAAGPGWTPPIPDELINVPALTKQILDKTQPVRQAFLQAVMTPTLKAAGLNFDVNNPLVQQQLASTGKHITSIAETTRENIRKSIAAGYQTGLSIPDTAKLIRAGSAGMANTRATMIARTELAGAANGGSLAATQIVSEETGAAYTKVWLTAPGAMYPRHETYTDLDGQTVGLDEPFNLEGEELMFPGDPSGDPGEVINCRCTMSYNEGEGEVTTDAEEGAPPDLSAGPVEGDLGGEGGGEGDLGGEDLMDSGGGGAEPMALPNNRFAAADQMMAGLAENERLAGKVPDMTQLAEGKANWERLFRGKIETDKVHLGAVRDADAYNLKSAVHQAQLAKYGQDAAVVVRPVKPNNLLYIKPGANAARMTGNRITVIAANEPGNWTGVREAIRPGDGGASRNGGLSATLRHEYAHQIYDGLSAEERASFLDALPDVEQAKNELTLYASTSPEEAFSELYAIVSDPEYDPSAWAPWVRQLGHDTFGSPLAEGGRVAEVVRPVVAPVLAPAGTGTLAADIANLKASSTWMTDLEKAQQDGRIGYDPTGGLAQVGLIPASELAQGQLDVAFKAGARVRQEMRLDTTLAQKLADAEAENAQLIVERDAEVKRFTQAYKDARAAYMKAEEVEQDRIAMGRYGKGYYQLDYEQKADVLKAMNDPAVLSPEVTRLKEAYHAAIDANTAAHDPMNPTLTRELQLKAAQAVKAARSEQAANVRDEAMRVLGEIRQMGSTTETRVEWGKVGSKAGPGITKAKALLELAQENLPTDWIGSLKPIDAGTSSRGYEQDFGVGHKIRVSDRRAIIEGDADGQQVALHELGHAVEAQNPMVQQLEQAFYQWRTRGGSFTADQERSYKMSKFQPGYGYGAKEIAREDKFADPYFGKDYSRGGRTMNFELLTMGLESLFNGSYVLDDEYVNWLLGVLALA